MTLNFIVPKGSTALTNIYCTSPGKDITFFNAAVNEFIATAMLLIGLGAITNNRPAFNKFHVAGFAGALIYAIGNVFGPLSGYALNPARDFGPRMCYLVFALIYVQSPTIWSEVMGNGYFIVPIVAPPLGAVVGGLIYRHFIFLEEIQEPKTGDSPRKSEELNRTSIAGETLC